MSNKKFALHYSGRYYVVILIFMLQKELIIFRPGTKKIKIKIGIFDVKQISYSEPRYITI